MTPETGGIIRHRSGASVAFLLVHGLFADVDELASLGEKLEEQGIASFAVRLTGHGTTPEHLATTTRDDWYRSVNEGLDLVKSWNPAHIFVAGLSTGSALTLLLSTRESGIDGIVVFSPAIMESNSNGPVPYKQSISSIGIIDSLYQSFTPIIEAPLNVKRSSKFGQGLFSTNLMVYSFTTIVSFKINCFTVKNSSL